MSDEPVDTPARRRGQSTLVSAVVAIGVIVGWLAYDRWVYPHIVQRLVEVETLRTRWYLFTLVDAMVRWFAPYALVLLLWGRTSRRRVGAALCAIATGVYVWGLYVTFDKWVWGDSATAAQATVYQWANLLVMSTGVALAWGIARRWGRIWMIGLVVAPVLAAVTRELAIHSAWWRTHLLFDHDVSHDLTRNVVFIAPSVIAAVVCWLIDAGTTRSAANPGPAPVAEMRASV